MALEPVFRHLAVLFIPSRDQVDLVSAAPEILESLCGVFPHRYRLKDSRNPGPKKLLDLAFGFVEGFFDVVGAFQYRFAEVIARFPEPDIGVAIVIICQDSIDIEAKDQT